MSPMEGGGLDQRRIGTGSQEVCACVCTCVVVVHFCELHTNKNTYTCGTCTC